MKLNELIRLRNQLADAIDTSILNLELEKNYNRLLNLTYDIDTDLSISITQIAHDHKNINALYQRDVDKIKDLLLVIQDKINTLAINFFAENYQLELMYLNADSIRKVRVLRPRGELEKVIYSEPSMTQDIKSNVDLEANEFTISDAVVAKNVDNDKITTGNESYDQFEKVLKQRINLHSNWQYPALEIGCRDGGWTKYLVASDPLYIADVFDDFLSSAVEQFPPLYQGRVKKYLIKDFYKIKNLPKNQFGLIFSYNFFNYLSLDSIKQLLIQAFEWLRPGGLIIFTYNNADLPAAASYAENYFMTYVPESILVPMAESLGFETVYLYNSEPAFSIIELKKPGKLNTTKVGQTVGEIKYIPIDLDKEIK
jgi:SAM-dependent methyltransferase